MANADTPFGLRPLRRLDGASWTGGVQKMLVEDDYGTALFIGDPVIITGGTGSDDASGHYNIANIASAGDTKRIAGAIVSIDPIYNNLSLKHIPATTGGYVYVVTDPWVVFAVQDNAGATLTSASVGANAVLASGTGSTVTGLSGWELAAATAPAANSSMQLVIVGVHQREDNTVGTNVIWEVLISNHLYLPAGTTNAEGILGI